MNGLKLKSMRLVPNDADLIAWFQSGDEQALETLFDRYETALFHFLLGVVKNHHMAEDALQETWCRALQNLQNVDANRFRGWLFTVAYRQAMLCKRRRRGGRFDSSIAPQQLTDPAPDPGMQAQSSEESRRVALLLERLPPAHREVICQRIWEGKRFRDIADTLNCPVNTVLGRMHEGLKKLRRLWGPEYA